MVSNEQINIIIMDIDKGGVIMESDKDESDFVSTVFIRYEKGGSVRTILDSKYQNGFAHHCHIEMEEKF